MTDDDMKNKLTGEFTNGFRPEFLNRIDEVIVCRKLTKDETKLIVDPSCAASANRSPSATCSSSSPVRRGLPRRQGPGTR